MVLAGTQTSFSSEWVPSPSSSWGPLLSAPSPLAAAASLGSPEFAALGLDLFCTLQREQLQKGSLKWEAGDSGGVGEKKTSLFLTFLESSGLITVSGAVCGIHCARATFAAFLN